jgi:Glycosyl transferases group 1
VHRAKCSARIVDYMAMGKPVLTSAVGQNSEYIVDGESGMLVNSADEEKFAEKLIELGRNPTLRMRLGSNAQARIVTKYRWDGEPLRQCLAAYERVMRGPHRFAAGLVTADNAKVHHGNLG